MSNLIPFFAKRYNDSYRKVVNMLDKINGELYNLQITEAELRKKKMELEKARDQIEHKITESMLLGGHSGDQEKV